MAITINPTIDGSSLYQAQANGNASAGKLASGSRINGAADDAASLDFDNRSDANIIEFQQAIRNANDGISLLQAADGSLGSINDNLMRFRELALQAAGGLLNDTDRALLKAEVLQLRDEINRIIASTSYNGRALLNSDNTLSIQPDGNEADSIEIQTQNIQQQLHGLGFDTIDVSSGAGARQAIGIVDAARQLIDQSAGSLAAAANRLQGRIDSLQSNRTDAEATRSRISDSDFARQISERSRNDILQQAGLAIQTQANLRSELVLRLLSS